MVVPVSILGVVMGSLVVRYSTVVTVAVLLQVAVIVAETVPGVVVTLTTEAGMVECGVAVGLMSILMHVNVTITSEWLMLWRQS